MKVEVFDDDGQLGRRRAGRAGVHGAVSEHAGRVLERSRWREVSRGVLRVLPERLAARRLGRDHRARWLIIYGRSDATLNPGGVRIGTAEIYRQVEQLPEVIESVVIGQDVDDDAGNDVRIVLFVRLAAGRDARRRAAGADSRADPGEHQSAPRAEEDHCRSRTFRARSAARSPSWRCATWCTGARSRTPTRWRIRRRSSCSGTCPSWRANEIVAVAVLRDLRGLCGSICSSVLRSARTLESAAVSPRSSRVPEAPTARRATESAHRAFATIARKSRARRGTPRRRCRPTSRRRTSGCACWRRCPSRCRTIRRRSRP